jgi:hypothetical protein
LGFAEALGDRPVLIEKMKKALKSETMRTSLLAILASVLLLFFIGTTVKLIGPYHGKVVDVETGEPIEGAVVLITFLIEGPYDVSSFGDAIEVLTGENGEYKIPRKMIIKIRPMHVWQTPRVLIFKPGYGDFPRHKGSLVEGGEYVTNKQLTIKLPKLKTRQERLDNLGMLGTDPSVPSDKKKIFINLKKKEFAELGLRSGF